MPRILFIILMALLARPSAASTLVCLGDSLTAGYGLSEAEAWPALVERKLKAAGLDWRVVNAGHSGDTSAGGLRRLDWQLKAKPEAVLVALGANDGLRGLKAAETEKNLDAILRTLKASGATALLAGMELPSNYGASRRAFREIYPRLAKKHKVEFLPFLLKGVGGVAALNQADGVHPTAEGQAIIAQTVFDFLKTRLKPAAPGAGQEAPRSIRSRKDLKK